MLLSQDLMVPEQVKEPLLRKSMSQTDVFFTLMATTSRDNVVSFCPCLWMREENGCKTIEHVSSVYQARHIQSQVGLHVLRRVSGRHVRRVTVASTTAVCSMDALPQAYAI